MIDVRMTNRLVQKKENLPDFFVSHLKTRKCRLPSIKLKVLTDSDSIKEFKSIISIADKLLLMNKKGHQGLYSEIAWAEDFTEQVGINVHSLGLNALELAGMQIARDAKVMEALRSLKGGSRFSEMNHKVLDTCSGVGLYTVDSLSQEQFFTLGQEIESYWLEACANGVSMHPITGLLYLILRLKHSKNHKFSEEEVNDLEHCDKRLRALFQTSPSDNLVFMFRHAIHTKAPKQSNRKPINDVTINLFPT